MRNEIERVVIALEAGHGDVSVQKWGECRDLLDVYLLKFRELMECLWDQYLRPLSADCSRKDLRQEFGPDLGAIHELSNAIVQQRDAIERVRTERCVRREFGGRKTLFPYFHSVLEPANWQRYASAVQERQRNIDVAVLGQLKHSFPAAVAQPRRPIFR